MGIETAVFVAAAVAASAAEVASASEKTRALNFAAATGGLADKAEDALKLRRYGKNH